MKNVLVFLVFFRHLVTGAGVGRPSFGRVCGVDACLKSAEKVRGRSLRGGYDFSNSFRCGAGAGKKFKRARTLAQTQY